MGSETIARLACLYCGTERAAEREACPTCGASQSKLVSLRVERERCYSPNSLVGYPAQQNVFAGYAAGPALQTGSRCTVVGSQPDDE